MIGKTKDGMKFYQFNKTRKIKMQQLVSQRDCGKKGKIDRFQWQLMDLIYRIPVKESQKFKTN